MATPLERPAKPPLEPMRRRGIYLLPNLFTTLNLFAGFYAIVQGMNHDFEKAAVAIFVAMVLDSLDGRVARLTRTQSAFGAEYDSLSDMVSFGAAPALVMYEWALRDMGRVGWIAAFVYCVGAALRLARFNTQLSVADKRWFTGLPSPAAAALVAGMIWVFNDYQVRGGEVKWLAAAGTIYAGITMVSNGRVYSGKDINLDLRDERGATALALAVEIGFQEAVEELLAAGANPNVHDLSGMTALDIADEHGAQDISALLLRHGAKSSKELAPTQP